MLQGPSIVIAPNIDQMGRLASTSSGSSDGTAQGASRARSALLNQDAAASPQHIKCPRCDSANTKFCYYNNYSQTQPRHFCKSCRRYWTQGGALRNVPVGGGCRKNKRVKQRPLINMGGAAGILDPSSLIDDTTSNMLARLTGNSPFPNFGSGAANFGGDDASTQLLNIAFLRFQESMRLRQQQQSSDQSPDAATPFFDMSFPGLVHKPCGPPSCRCGTCGSRGSLHQGTCGGLMNAFENNLGFTNLPVKMEHDPSMASFCSSGYELNSLYHDQNPSIHSMVGTSATATLARLEEQLSNFSNLSHVDQFNADTCTVPEQNSSLDSAKRMVSAPLQLLGHGGSHQSISVENTSNTMSTEIPNDTKEKLFMDEKPLGNNANNELSLMMATDNWQQPSFMNEMLFDTHHNMWNSHGTRWQDMHALATSTATAGGVL